MRHQMENGDWVGRGTQRHRHVTQLGNGGVSNDTFDVVLDDAQKSHEECRYASDHHNEAQGGVTELK